MIINLQATEQTIVDWIKTYAKSAGISTLVVGLSGGVDSALTALLCKKTGLPTVCVNMPCHSSNKAYELAKAFAIEFSLPLKLVDLSQAHESITKQMGLEDNLAALGGLRSCLRAPTLSYVALQTKGLIVGTGNRSEDNLIRYFQKFGDGCVDISPISDLFKSEIYQLFEHMTGITRSGGSLTGPASAVAIRVARPTADLWGPDGEQDDEKELGISYDEIEWADRENINNNIISDGQDPARHRAWLGYSMRQRLVIAKVHQLEKISRHKFNPNLPVCKVREMKGLVK